MTVSEVLPIAGLSDEALIALIQPGDMLRIEGPGENEVAVRFVDSYKEIPSVVDNCPVSVARLVRQESLTITNVARPIPEVELPTVPGYYVSKNQVYINTPLTLFRNGEWVDGYGRTMSEERLHYLMPLTRLVPETETTPAKLADRLDVDKLADVMSRKYHGSSDYWDKDAAAIIAAIDNGEVDK